MSQRTAVLDDIAWPARAKPEFAHGVAFFTSFRDLTAAGFWTTRMGIDDLQYLGNRSVAQMERLPGCRAQEAWRELRLKPGSNNQGAGAVGQVARSWDSSGSCRTPLAFCTVMMVTSMYRLFHPEIIVGCRG